MKLFGRFMLSVVVRKLFCFHNSVRDLIMFSVKVNTCAPCSLCYHPTAFLLLDRILYFFYRILVVVAMWFNSWFIQFQPPLCHSCSKKINPDDKFGVADTHLSRAYSNFMLIVVGVPLGLACYYHFTPCVTKQVSDYLC
nr:ORF3 [Recilia dorsalis filamentous virus]